VVVPFLVASDARSALRISNGIAIVMLFLTGYAFARLTGRQPWLVGALMVVLGVALVGITMALGG
jgi:VIT1/CCC1 family predicted Fe2+/Mn2+ transporter